MTYHEIYIISCSSNLSIQVSESFGNFAFSTVVTSDCPWRLARPKGFPQEEEEDDDLEGHEQDQAPRLHLQQTTDVVAHLGVHLCDVQDQGPD